MNIYVFVNSDAKIPNSQNWLKEYQYNLMYYKSDEEANKLFSNKKPEFILSVSNGPDTDFKTLYKMPDYIRNRWTHRNNLADFTVEFMKFCIKDLISKRLGP